MKRPFYLFLCALILLCGCLPTPDVGALRQKNQAEMVDMAKVTPEVTDAAREPVQIRLEVQGPDYRAIYDIPEHLCRELAGADGRLIVRIDADMKVTEKAMPIERV